MLLSLLFLKLIYNFLACVNSCFSCCEKKPLSRPCIFYYKQGFTQTINHLIPFHSYRWTSRVRPDPIYHVIFLAEIARKKASTSQRATPVAPLKKNVLYFGARERFLCIAQRRRQVNFKNFTWPPASAIQNSV